LKIWITPLASVAMLEKFGLLKMARCSASAVTIDSSVCPAMAPEAGYVVVSAMTMGGAMVMACPDRIFGPAGPCGDLAWR
jgi:hypothetical protein